MLSFGVRLSTPVITRTMLPPMHVSNHATYSMDVGSLGAFPVACPSQVDKASYAVVDFDDGNVDIKVYISANDSAAAETCAFDLTLEGGVANKSSIAFCSPKLVCNGSLLMSRRIALVCVPVF